MMRSLLYVPADNDRFIAKASQRGADAIILDLEDAVVPAAKAGARDALLRTVAEVCRDGAKVFVRVNAGADMMALDAEAACRAGAYGLYVPKVGSPAVLERLARQLEPLERSIGREPMVFVPLIEEPDAVFEARAIAKAERVWAISVGGEDLATAMGAKPSPETLRLPKQMVHLAAKAAGVLSFGLMRSIADYADIEGVATAAREARHLGFDGASCVHPSVVPILNQAFSPTAEEIDWARRVVEAAEAEGRGAFLLDGKFIDLPIVRRARDVLGTVGAL